MSSKLKVELNRAGVRELLRSGEMMAECEKHANAALGRLGEGYAVTTQTGRNRVNAEVAAVTFKARRDNLENNTILRALK